MACVLCVRFIDADDPFLLSACMSVCDCNVLHVIIGTASVLYVYVNSTDTLPFFACMSCTVSVFPITVFNCFLLSSLLHLFVFSLFLINVL